MYNYTVLLATRHDTRHTFLCYWTITTTLIAAVPTAPSLPLIVLRSLLLLLLLLLLAITTAFCTAYCSSNTSGRGGRRQGLDWTMVYDYIYLGEGVDCGPVQRQCRDSSIVQEKPQKFTVNLSHSQRPASPAQTAAPAWHDEHLAENGHKQWM